MVDMYAILQCTLNITPCDATNVLHSSKGLMLKPNHYTDMLLPIITKFYVFQKRVKL